VIGLVQNAFFKAILPGFDLEAARGRREEEPRGEMTGAVRLTSKNECSL